MGRVGRQDAPATPPRRRLRCSLLDGGSGFDACSLLLCSLLGAGSGLEAGFVGCPTGSFVPVQWSWVPSSRCDRARARSGPGAGCERRRSGAKPRGHISAPRRRSAARRLLDPRSVAASPNLSAPGTSLLLVSLS